MQKSSELNKTFLFLVFLCLASSFFLFLNYNKFSGTEKEKKIDNFQNVLKIMEFKH